MAHGTLIATLLGLIGRLAMAPLASAEYVTLAINEVLQNHGFAPLTKEDLAPLKAA